MAKDDGGKFAIPTDPEVRYSAFIALGALLFLVFVSRAFRDVNAA